MSKLSSDKKQKISEQILSVLFNNFPNSLFTSKISEQIIRDEEFTKQLLFSLKENKLIISIHQNSKGTQYLKRIRWRLSNQTHNLYSKKV